MLGFGRSNAGYNNGRSQNYGRSFNNRGNSQGYGKPAYGKTNYGGADSILGKIRSSRKTTSFQLTKAEFSLK